MLGIVKKDLKGLVLELAKMEIPKPKPGYVLIKIDAAPINPSDFGFIKGTYGDLSLQRKPPVVLGFEGAGKILGVGENVDKAFIGKKVCFFANCHSQDFIGSWATHTAQPISALTFVPEKVSTDVACMSQINPKTCMGFWHYISQDNHKAIIQTAAASALGKMLIKLCKTKGVDTINVVRGKKNMEILSKLGAEHILDSESPSFEKELGEKIEKLKPTGFFDAVGGELTGKIFNPMPMKSVLYVYGSLQSADLLGIKGTDLRYKDKTIRGYHVTKVFESMKPEQRKEYIDFIWNDLEGEGKIFKSDIAKTFSLENFKEALSAYNSLASEGKIVFKP